MFHRRGVGYDPFNMAIPLHEAWQGLLEGYLPHLLAEAEGAAGFLLLRKNDVKGESGDFRIRCRI